MPLPQWVKILAGFEQLFYIRCFSLKLDEDMFYSWLEKEATCHTDSLLKRLKEEKQYFDPVISGSRVSALPLCYDHYSFHQWKERKMDIFHDIMPPSL